MPSFEKCIAPVSRSHRQTPRLSAGRRGSADCGARSP
jgi:hypothetical protein